MTDDSEIEASYRQQMNTLANALDEMFNGEERPKRICFVLLVAPFGEGLDHRTNYISNGRRQDIVVLMKEVLARFEGQPELKGNA